MFQSFESKTTPATGATRLTALRGALGQAGFAGFLVPRADAHMGENVAPCDERLAWLTSFTGSSGQCAVLADQAGLFVDGRYRLQVRAEVDTAVITPVAVPENQLGDWLAKRLTKGARLAYDPWLHGQKEIDELTEALAAIGALMEPSDNLVDRIWSDRPAPPAARATIHGLEFAGEPHGEKRLRIGADLGAKNLRATVLTLPASIAWLLNIRGADIERTPVVLAFAILHADGKVQLFANPDKFDADLRAHLGAQVSIAAPEALGAALDALKGPVTLDKASAPVWIADRLRAAKIEIKWQRDPCTLPKAQKNPVEMAGSRAAHLRDGAAMVEFLCWLDHEAPKGQLTEIDVVRALEARRRATNALRDISFETICGAGPNGAIVHYRVNEASNRPVKSGELLLVDSGGQYEDGTTDITRTVATGPVDPEARRAFTLVLKGMIALAMVRFPAGIAGRDIDALARAALWQAGYDYDHGTGHGVGAFLGVHEGPQNISRRGEEVLLPGMILSNEPGCYIEGSFGIRIENLQVVTAASQIDGGDRAMLGFETLTLAPIDRRLIDKALLTRTEVAWLDGYHARVEAELTRLISKTAYTWLAKACAAL